MQNQPSKVALVTGAARRIGAEIARELHHAGINIIVHYLTSEQAAKELCIDLNKQRPASAIPVQADLSKLNEITFLLDQTLTPWGRLDILINNASQFYKTSWGQATEACWDDLINTNLKGPFFLSQAAAPHLIKTNGCIVNIGDIYAERPLKDYPIYSISKAGLIMLTKTSAKELAPYVRVNAVLPAGGICWPEGENQLSEARKEKIIQSTALKRAGHPIDIAKAVLFFVMKADYMTGQTLSVDGGRF